MGNRIREIRLDRGLSQEALAAKINTTKAQISKLENSERRLTLEWMYRLARGLECHHVELIDDTGPVSAEETELLKTYRGLSEDERPIARRVLTAMRRPGNGADTPNDES